MGKHRKRNRGKKRSKTAEVTLQGQSNVDPNDKKVPKKISETARYRKPVAKSIDKKVPKKISETARYRKPVAESNLEEVSDIERTKKILLHGKWDPEKIYYDIYRFICHWAYMFGLVFATTNMVLHLSGNTLLSINYDGTLWKTVLAVCVIYLVAAISAVLSLEELPGLLTFLLKYAAIFSFLTAGAFTVVIFTESDLIEIVIDETFVKTLNWMCKLVSIISGIAALYVIYDANKLKKELRCFLHFVPMWGFIFGLFLVMLMFLIIIHGENMLGIDFDEIFIKIVASIFIIQVLVAASMVFLKYF